MDKFFLIVLLIFSCEKYLIEGCTIITACNYNEQANVVDGSCEYVVDCNGVCGGASV